MSTVLLQQFPTSFVSTLSDPAGAYQSQLLGNGQMLIGLPSRNSLAVDLLSQMSLCLREIGFAQAAIQQVGTGLTSRERNALTSRKDVPDSMSQVSKRGSRNRELSWLKANKEQLAHFIGEWIVLGEDGIIAHSVEPLEAVRQARERGIRAPLLYRVEGERPKGVGRLGL